MYLRRYFRFSLAIIFLVPYLLLLVVMGVIASTCVTFAILNFFILNILKIHRSSENNIASSMSFRFNRV